MQFRLIRKKIQFLTEDIWDWLSAPRIIALLMFLGGMLGLVMDYISQQGYQITWSQSLENNIFIAMSPNIVSIAIGVLIIDWANARVSKLHKKEELIYLLQSEFSAKPLEALAEFRASGWLYDGTLERANLTQAKLQDANFLSSFFFEPEVGSIVRLHLSPKLKGAGLKFTCLKGANLVGADLRNTDLFATDLSGAQLNGAKLQSASLRAADCTRTDLRGAALNGSNLTDANLKDANISENFPLCDQKTVLPDGTYWSSNHDLYRFVDQSREDFWEAPNDKVDKIEDHRNVPE
jgi:uncharacterized protein YjbI with pentapeptide repeats